MPLQIKVEKGNYLQEQTVTLNGDTFYFVFRYDSAYSKNNWVMDILDSDRNYLLPSKRINPVELTNRKVLREVLQGTVFCLNKLNDNSDITADNFHTDGKFIIVYYSQQELDDAVSAQV